MTDERVEQVIEEVMRGKIRGTQFKAYFAGHENHQKQVLLAISRCLKDFKKFEGPSL